MRLLSKKGIAAFVMAVMLASSLAPASIQAQNRWGKASGWAEEGLQGAVDNDMYPEAFDGADLSKDVTRAQFAAVAVHLFERLYGNAVPPAPPDTFTDTSDPNVLKAFSANLVSGVGGGRFAPDESLNREEAASMLARVFKKLFWAGWTLEGDAAYTQHVLDSEGVPPLADDAQISGWAKPSVYFMVKYGIISGVGDNRFAPKDMASAEAALLIGNRMYEFVVLAQDDVLGEESVQESYIFGEDVIPAIPGVLGRRDCPTTSKGTSLSDGVNWEEQVYTYRSDTVVEDLTTYLGLLLYELDFLNTTDIDLAVMPGQAVLAAPSAEPGMVVLITINYNLNGYTVKIAKGKGSVERFD